MNVSLKELLTNETIMLTLEAITIFLSFMLLRKILTKYIFKLIFKITSKTKTTVDEEILIAFEKPLLALLLFLGLYLALKILPLGAAFDYMLNGIFRSLIVIMIAWGIYDLAGTGSLLSDEFKDKLNMDNALIAFFSKVIRFMIIAIAFVLVAHEWNYDVNGFVAGLGLGGLAFALAAKDMLANIFGGIVIIMEKPFSIGDLVQTAKVEGIVEDISFRSTRFRNISQAIVTVPNSTLASEPITNLSRVSKLLLDFNLKVSCSTPVEKIDVCVERIKIMLQNHPEVDHETVHVYFEKIGDKSLDILINCYTQSIIRVQYLTVRENINFEILRILTSEDILLA